MGTLTVIEKPPKQSGERVVARLELLLQEAKGGKYVNFMFTGVSSDNSVTMCWPNAQREMTLVGGVMLSVKRFQCMCEEDFADE